VGKWFATNQSLAWTGTAAWVPVNAAAGSPESFGPCGADAAYSLCRLKDEGKDPNGLDLRVVCIGVSGAYAADKAGRIA